MAGASSVITGATAVESNTRISAAPVQPYPVQRRFSVDRICERQATGTAFGCPTLVIFKGGCLDSTRPKPSLFLSARRRVLTPRRILLHIVLHPNLPRRILRTHIPNLPKNRTLRPPSPIVSSQTPENSAVRVRIAPIQAVFVVQMNQHFRRVLRRPRPFQNFLPPKHPQIIVNPPLANKLHLR